MSFCSLCRNISDTPVCKSCSAALTDIKSNPQPTTPIKESGGALRYDTDKPRMDLLSMLALEGCARVLTKGAKKYASHNWRKGMPWSKTMASLLRHYTRFSLGEDYDYDPNCPTCVSKTCVNHTGELHVDQILCNAMFLAEYARTHKELDDRFKILTPGVAANEGGQSGPQDNGNNNK
jgi:hypothetical protein